MERGALSTSLSVLLALFLAQFFVGMALNLLVTFPTNVFPASGGSFTAAVSYAFTGGNLLLTSHSIIDLAIIAVGAVNWYSYPQERGLQGPVGSQLHICSDSYGEWRPFCGFKL